MVTQDSEIFAAKTAGFAAKIRRCRMIALNVVLSLIMQSKCKGKGIISNGKIYSSLMLCISDHRSESDLLNCFNNEAVPKEALRKMDRFLSRFLRDGKGYPYELMSFNGLENSFDDPEKMAVYLQKLEAALDKFLDVQKLDDLIFTLLKLIRQDSDTKKILYGGCYIDKEKLFGRYVHQKCICVEALLLGLLYQCHKTPCQSEGIELLKCDDRSTFLVVRNSDDEPFDLDRDIDIIEHIRSSARKQDSEKYEYPLEFIYNGEKASELPQNDQLFIQGIRSSGKTALLKSLINSDDSAFLYFSLDSYRCEIHSGFSSVPCWIILSILLKYHYQYEYTTYETLSANVGEDSVLKQLSLLNEALETEPVYNKNWTLLLDGMDQLSIDLYDSFAQETDHIRNSWKNVRIIIAGRVLPEIKAFSGFEQVGLSGICDDYLHTVSTNKELYELLKNPTIFQIYAAGNENAQTAGELLDLYFSQWQGNDVIRFLIHFALPLVGKKMLDDWETHDLSRAEVMQLIDRSLNIYVLDDQVYQDHVKVRNIDKKCLLESRRNDDWIELLIKNTGLIASADEPSMLRFTERYYRDYFAAKHIVNAVEIFETGSNITEDKEQYLCDIGLSGIWFDEPERFPEKYDAYKMLGEICRERLKFPDNDEFYDKNALDRFLDICRGIDGGYSAENVIIVKKMIHNNRLYHVDFRYLNLPLLLPGDVSFSLDGEYPCDFYKSRVYRVADSEDNTMSFKNCDFTEATFLDMEIKEKIHQLGGIVDFEDDSFMDESFRESVLPWIYPLPQSRYSEVAKEFLKRRKQ